MSNLSCDQCGDPIEWPAKCKYCRKELFLCDACFSGHGQDCPAQEGNRIEMMGL